MNGPQSYNPAVGRKQVRTIRVPKAATVALLLIVSTAMAASIYSLSGRAYVQERASIVDLAWMLRHRDQPTSILAILAPAAVDVLFFLPWGALTFLAIDRDNIPRGRTYLASFSLGLAFALGLVAWQQLLPTRVTGWVDVGWNAAGCLAGAMIGHARKRFHIRFQ